MEGFTSREIIKSLLADDRPEWEGLSTIEIAIKGKSRAFVAQDIVHKTLGEIWWGSIDHEHMELNPVLKPWYFISLLMPPLAPVKGDLFVNFRSPEVNLPPFRHILRQIFRQIISSNL